MSPRIPRKYHRGHVANVKRFTPHNAAKRNMIALAALVFPWPGVWEWGDIVSITMKLLRKEQSLVWCFSASLLLGGCGGAGPECGSLDTDTRNSVVKIVSDDSNNKLVNYAVKNSSSVAAMVAGTKSEVEKLEIWEKARQGAVYRLGDAVPMNPSNRTGQEVTCIGLLYVTVADATAQKEVEFKVKQTADRKIIVSVNPFLF